jgi:hypothetical protein
MKQIFTGVVLHSGWASDSSLWIEQDSEGKKHLKTTNHGSECEMSEESLDEKIEETERSLAGLLEAKKIAFN